MPAEGERRRRSRKDQGEEPPSPKKKDDGGRSRRKKGDRGAQPDTSWISRLCCEVCPCKTGPAKISSGDKAAEDKEKQRRLEKKKKEREKKKKKEREQNSGERDAGSCRGAEGNNGAEDEEDGCMTARTDASATSCYTSRSAYTAGEDEDGAQSARSGAQSARSGRSAKDRKADRQAAALKLAGGAGGGSRPGSQRAPASNSRGGGGGEVQVLSLADLRGQELPNFLGGGGDGSQSARSCRSDAQSVRSDAVKSVASTSVKQYMGHLSEKRSSADVKKMVKDFVREMIKGREMSVLRADGVLRPVTCGLSRQLDVFRIKSGDQVRKLKLAEIERVVRGPSEDFADLDTPLDEMCSTLEMDTQECISFKFAERRKAELFTMCMSLFLDGQKK